MSRPRRSAKRVPVIAGLLLVALMLWVQNTEFAPVSALRERLELLAYDLRLNAALPVTPTRPPPIVIVDIDEASLRAEGQWPWSRTRIADLVDRLSDAGVAVIAFDILFAEPERNPVQQILSELKDVDPSLAQALAGYSERIDADRRLAAGLQRSDSVLGFVLHNEPVSPSGTLPKPVARFDAGAPVVIPEMQSVTGNLSSLQAAAGAGGFLTTLPDHDGAIRRSPLLLRHDGAVYPSLALAAASAYLLVDGPRIHLARVGRIDAVDHLTLGEQYVPVDAAGQVLVPYRGPARSFPSLSATDVLQGRIDPALLENRIALIGTSALGLADLKATPVAGVFPGV
jgi:adenylate cyclase